MFLQLTHEDLFLLEKIRLERFQSCFQDVFDGCWLYLDRGNQLKIHCSEPWLVDVLLSKLERLVACAWIILGASQLSIYYAQEEIYTSAISTIGAQLPRSPSACDFPLAS